MGKGHIIVVYCTGGKDDRKACGMNDAYPCSTEKLSGTVLQIVVISDYSMGTMSRDFAGNDRSDVIWSRLQ